MLRETKGLNEAGLSVEDLPLLAKSIRIIHDDFTVTGNVVPRLVLALLDHEATTSPGHYQFLDKYS
jgi:hypothetical protein